MTKQIAIALFLSWCVSEVALGNDEYIPWLYKVKPELEKVIVLDLTLDKADGSKIPMMPGMSFSNRKNCGMYDLNGYESQAMEALASITCIQGFVNREDTTKIYLKNFPMRTLWDGHYAGPGNATEDALRIGLIPYPLVEPALDTTKTYPVLSWLLDQYVSSGRLKLKGKIIVPAGTSHANSPVRAAGITACAFEDALYVSEAMLSYLEQEGLGDDKLPVVADLRKMQPETAIKWSLKYCDDRRMNKQMVAFFPFYGPQNPPDFFDYVIAARIFCWYLPCPKFTAENKPESMRRYAEVLIGSDEKNPRFPYGTPAVGDVEQGNSIQAHEQLGYCAIYGHIPNASITSSIPTDPEKFKPLEAEALPVDPDAAYISWGHECDGDALDFVVGIGFKNLLNDPASGSAPLGWRVNPVFIDLYPTLFEWYSKFHPHMIDICSSMNDSSHPYTKAGEAHWYRMYKHYLDASNGAIKVINHFNRYRPTVEKALKIGDENDPLLIICGHVDDHSDSNLELHGKTVFSNAGQGGDMCIHEKPWESPEASERRVADEIADIKQFLENAKPSEPCFILSRGFHTNGTVVVGDAFATMQKLQADPTIKRKLHFCRPSVLALTFRKWEESRGQQ